MKPGCFKQWYDIFLLHLRIRLSLLYHFYYCCCWWWWYYYYCLSWHDASWIFLRPSLVSYLVSFGFFDGNLISSFHPVVALPRVVWRLSRGRLDSCIYCCHLPLYTNCLAYKVLFSLVQYIDNLFHGVVELIHASLITPKLEISDLFLTSSEFFFVHLMIKQRWFIKGISFFLLQQRVSDISGRTV